jgi:hypothetical protein
VSFEVGEPPATLTGGDPSGTWIVTSGKVYLPNSASFAFDRNASKGELSGWAKFQGKDALVDIRLNATTVVLGQSSPYQETLSGRGPSEVTGNQLRVAWACPQEGGAASGTIGFSVHGDGATLVYKEAAGNLGDIYMVAEATRAP